VEWVTIIDIPLKISKYDLREICREKKFDYE
jgi:hypothetical protein